MVNITHNVEKDTLVIRVDLTQTHGQSKSGKTITVATTNGFQPIIGKERMMFSLNVNKK